MRWIWRECRFVSIWKRLQRRVEKRPAEALAAFCYFCRPRITNTRVMAEEMIRYSDKELAEFKKLIQEKIDKAEKDLLVLRENFANDRNNGTDDTAPTFKAFEEGSDTMSKEANSQLAIRQEKFIRDLKNAILRIENKTYGVCRETGKLISKERLMLVPHTTLSIDAKNKQ
jgi:RNA polymerase-binding transcription factor DksA